MGKRHKFPIMDVESNSSSASSSDDTSPDKARRRKRRSRSSVNARKTKDKDNIRMMVEQLNEQMGNLIESQNDQSKEMKRLIESQNDQSKEMKRLIESQNGQSKVLEKLIESQNGQSKELEKLTACITKYLGKQLEFHTNITGHAESNAPRSQMNQVPPPRYQLVFRFVPTDKIETGKTIIIIVALVEAISGRPVEDGSLASIPVQLVVVNSKFNQYDNQHNWSREDFERNIVKPRCENSAAGGADQSVKSIVSNGRFNLDRGVGCYSGSAIFENSHNRKVRLAAMAVFPTEERVLEALSNPLLVRDHVQSGKQSNLHPNSSNGQSNMHPNSSNGQIDDGEAMVEEYLHRENTTHMGNGHVLGPAMDMQFPRTMPVQLVWDRPNVGPIKRDWNLLDQLMRLPKFSNCGGLPTKRLMQEHLVYSRTIMSKEVMQARRNTGVIIEPLEPDDSDERQLKRKMCSKYQLRFVNKVCEGYHIMDPIKADDGNPLKVALFDGNRKITNGPLSSAPVKIVALHGDFNDHGQDYFTSEEFNSCEVCPQPGEEASSVLGGDCILVLSDGEACLGDAFFQMTSYCARTGKFKMGVKLASPQEERIQEGVSESFWVTDRHCPGECGLGIGPEDDTARINHPSVVQASSLPPRPMSSAYASRHRGSGMSTTTVLAAKVAFASAALAAAASFARLAVPQLVSVAGAVLPRAWTVARFWLVPPYLFVTVHLIILVIWKLSDHKHFHQAQAPHHKDPWPVSQHHAPHPAPAAVPSSDSDVAAPAAAVKAKEEFDFSAGDGEPLEREFSPDSGGGESCVTTESDEDATSSPSYVTDVRRSRAPAHQHAVLEREPSLPSQTLDCDGDGDGDDDLDATWKAIMQKTRPAAAAAPAPAPPPPAQQSPQRPPPRARDPSVGAEEMNRRFDDFIKKNRNSFGRQ